MNQHVFKTISETFNRNRDSFEPNVEKTISETFNRNGGSFGPKCRNVEKTISETSNRNGGSFGPKCRNVEKTISIVLNVCFKEVFDAREQACLSYVYVDVYVSRVFIIYITLTDINTILIYF